jgi:hypothetical protein
MQDMPMQPTPPSASPSENLLKQICKLASGSSAWMKFLGVLSIIQGIVLIFTIWGILICWLPIWLGVILFKAAGDAEMASKGAATRMTDYLQKLNRYFLIQGILSLIMIIIGLVLVFVAGMAFFAGMLGHM